MHSNEETYYFFLGIGGIGMSALARFYQAKGYKLMGYDKTETELTQQLQQEGIPVVYEDNPQLFPTEWTAKNTIVIFTPAVPNTSQWHNFFREQGFVCKKRAEMLGDATKNTINLSVAGTHGKTTTSSMVGHILAQADYPVTALLGGILLDYDSNLILKGTEYSVTEADEYDRSFLQLSPETAVITSMDADHLDIYKNPEEFHKTFALFAKRVRKNVIVKKGLPLAGNYTYSAGEKADFMATNIDTVLDKVHFDLILLTEKIHITLINTGQHNIENAVAAAAMAYLHGVGIEKIKRGLESFGGVKRRFNTFYGKRKILIDDYAHHPTEIAAMRKAIKERYPNSMILVIFQPHLYSRTRDFLDEFISELGKFPFLLLLDIYPAREEPIPGITSEYLASRLPNSVEVCNDLDDAILYIDQNPNWDVIVTLGAGNIDLLVEPLKGYIDGW